MKLHRILFTASLVCLVLPVLISCQAGKKAYDPAAKFAASQLQKDYRVFRGVLETAHPGLYWYQPKDSMDYFFDRGFAALKDSMNENDFRTLLSYVIAKVDCGHTSMKPSRAYSRYVDTAQGRAFPLAIKFWPDTMVVTANLNRKDSMLHRGTVLLSIDGRNSRQLTDTLFEYITTDGYSITGKYQTLSTGFTFASVYKNVFGLKDTTEVRYLDDYGIERSARLSLYDFKADTMNKKPPQLDAGDKSKRKHLPQLTFFASVNLQLDTVGKTAFMTVGTFDRSNHLRRFFKRSFREIQKDGITDLVVDVRSNGGGDAGLSTLLTRYLTDHSFRLADSLYTVRPPARYNRYIESDFWYNILARFVTRRKKDGKYHFSYFERHTFKPGKKNHFNGQVYILTGGNSFSATTLFAQALKGQKNVQLIGEETGGGHYGNTAWIIQDVTLPQTRIRFRLPRFRMVMNRNDVKDGRGIMPDVWALPTSDAIRDGLDFKALKAKDLIEARRAAMRTGQVPASKPDDSPAQDAP